MNSADKSTLRWRDPIVLTTWAFVMVINTVANGYVAAADHSENPAWQPWLWEISSAAMVLALLPAVLWLEERFPFSAGNWLKPLAIHLLASMAFCVLHVVGMVLIRTFVYQTQASHYDFGNWPRNLFYEYSKDFRTYAAMVGLSSLTRFWLLRSNGEARNLSTTDPGIPAVSEQSNARTQRFIVRKLDRDFLIAANDIERIEASGNYMNLHVGSRVYPLRSTMTALIDQLDPAIFQRVHRSHVVRLDQVQSIAPGEDGDATLHLLSGQQVPCSRTYRSAIAR